MTVISVPPGFESPLCTICRNKDSEHFAWGDFHLNLLPPIQVAKCRNCGMIFLSPRPDDGLRLQFMQDKVPQELLSYTKNSASYHAVTKQRNGTFMKRLNQLESLLGFTYHNTPPKILDVGASAGTFAKLASERGWSAFGVEPSWSGTRAALEQGLQFPIAVAELLPFADDTFNVVHSHHVFEHQDTFHP